MTCPELERHESGGVMAAMLHVCWAEPGVGVGDGPEERAGLLCILTLPKGGHRSQSLASELEL